MATSIIPQVTNNSGSGYCEMPDGTLIQWGTISNLTFDNKVSIGSSKTMTKSFVDTNFSVIATSFGSSNSDLVFRMGCDATAVNKFDWRMVSGSNQALSITNRAFFWIAIGRWK